MQKPDIDRRKFLISSLLTLGATCIPSISLASVLKSSPRRLQMSNLHTGEVIETQYFDGQEYCSSELQKINHFCRDFRENKAIKMDARLFDQLSNIQKILGSQNQIQIISGYRSPKTNKMLSKGSKGVAKKSLHMQGKAIDFRIQGIPLAEVRKAALSLKTGGVGYYPKSHFVHIDTGHFRFW